MKENMFNILGFKKSEKLKTKDSNTTESKEKKEPSYWDRMKSNFAKYITKNILNGYGKLEYAKPLSILENHKNEVATNKELSKFSGNISKEEIYAKALEVAKQFGWQEEKINSQNELSNRFVVDEKGEITDKNNKFEEKNKDLKEKKEEDKNPEEGIPVFITNKLRKDLKVFGFTDQEIDKMKPKEAWEALKKKDLEQELKDPKKEKIITLDELSEDFSILQKMWDEAYEKMNNVSESSKVNELLNLTGKTIDDPKPLEDYLEKEAQNLNPEEKFFIEMSIQIKKFRAKSKELLGL